MNKTQLLYMSNMTLLECKAKVVKVEKVKEKDIIYLDQTIFYPQEGGQPYDQGKIVSGSSSMKVEEVRCKNGIVSHIGLIDGEILVGDDTTCKVDKERREINSRLHSAGHIIDIALESIGLGWIPGKGFHFPEGPYVEYRGEFRPEERDELIPLIERTANSFIEDSKTQTQFVEKSEMHTVCKNVPTYLSENKPVRVVMFHSHGVPCGGTHVENLKDIGSISIRKLRQKKSMVKISYSVS